MPLSRPMPIVGEGVHELRFRDSSGIYRLVYILLGAGTIWLLHAFVKKIAQTPRQNIELARKRLKEIL
jgi:phage-related protein